MSEEKYPRLRTVTKVKPPFPLNQFPPTFGYTLGKEIVYLLATKTTPKLEGPEWEQIFSKCVGGIWKPSNVGLDDVVLENCAWSAKSVKQSNPQNSKKVRLISGRNSPQYSYGETSFDQDPDYLGKQILSIWNERVSAIKKNYKHLRTVVLIKSDNLQKLAVFEFETIRYDPDLYSWKWNINKNLTGHMKSNDLHCFTWQPHGSQFTIIEKVPVDCLLINVKAPPKLDQDVVLKSIHYDDSWITVSRRSSG